MTRNHNMKTTTTSLLLAAGLAGFGSAAYGNAFNINEHDAKVTGRGGAAAASDTEASSVVFNPGGIPIAEGAQVSVNGSLYLTRGSYEPAGGGAKVNTDSAPSVVPSISATARIHDMVGVGVALHLPFGLAVSWPNRHPQQAVIQDQSLRTYFITAAVGVNLEKYVPGLSFGGGVDLVPATVQLERAVVFGDAQGTAVLGGDAFGIGGRAGIMYRPPALKQLKLGAMWRSQIKLNFEGNGDFDIDQPYRDQLPPDGAIATSITLPQSFTGGVAYSPIPRLEIEANVVWINWSKFKELRIELPGGSATVAPEDYQNTTTFRLGGEYAINDQAAVRAGFIYDPTPIPDTTQTAQLPDINRFNVTLGGTYKFRDYAASLGLLWVTPGERQTSDALYMPLYKGTYGVQAFVTALTLSGTFGFRDQRHR